MSNYIILIPFRSGSKGLKNKNIKLVFGKPLYYWTLKIAREIGVEIYISTDYKKNILTYLSDNESFIARSEQFSRDETLMSEVISDFIKSEKIINKNIILLQVTSPLRVKEDILNCIKRFELKKHDLVTTICKTENNSLKFGFFNDNNFTPVNNSEFCFSNRQSLPYLYKLTGSVYVFNSNWFLSNNGFVTDKIGGVLVDQKNSVDIDNIKDINLINKI